MKKQNFLLLISASCFLFSCASGGKKTNSSKASGGGSGGVSFSTDIKTGSVSVPSGTAVEVEEAKSILKIGLDTLKGKSDIGATAKGNLSFSEKASYKSVSYIDGSFEHSRESQQETLVKVKNLKADLAINDFYKADMAASASATGDLTYSYASTYNGSSESNYGALSPVSDQSVYAKAYYENGTAYLDVDPALLKLGGNDYGYSSQNSDAPHKFKRAVGLPDLTFSSAIKYINRFEGQGPVSVSASKKNSKYSIVYTIDPRRLFEWEGDDYDDDKSTFSGSVKVWITFNESYIYSIGLSSNAYADAIEAYDSSYSYYVYDADIEKIQRRVGERRTQVSARGEVEMKFSYDKVTTEKVSDPETYYDLGGGVGSSEVIY